MNPETPLTVVVGVDYSELAREALLLALRHARAAPSATVHALAVAEGDPRLSGEALAAPRESFLREAEATLGAWLQGFREQAAPGVTLVPHVVTGSPAEQIVELARKVGADLVVVGTHGRRGLERLLLGSVAEEVVRRSPTAVMVARKQG